MEKEGTIDLSELDDELFEKIFKEILDTNTNWGPKLRSYKSRHQKGEKFGILMRIRIINDFSRYTAKIIISDKEKDQLQVFNENLDKNNLKGTHLNRRNKTIKGYPDK